MTIRKTLIAGFVAAAGVAAGFGALKQADAYYKAQAQDNCESVPDRLACRQAYKIN